MYENNTKISVINQYLIKKQGRVFNFANISVSISSELIF